MTARQTPAKPAIRDAVLFARGRYGLPSCTETLAGYLKAAGMPPGRGADGRSRRPILGHGMGAGRPRFA